MTEQNPTSRAAHLEPLSMMWRVFAAPQTLLLIMGLLALSLALGSLIPQIPPQAVDDPQAWLAIQPRVFGLRNGFFRALGLYDVYHALWYHVLLGLAGLIVFVRFVDSAELAWDATARKRWTANDFSHWGKQAAHVSLSSPYPIADLLARLHSYLSRLGYHWTGASGLSPPNLVISRQAPFLWAQPVMHGALLVALVGLAILGNWGWQNEEWQPARGESQPVGHGSPLAVRLDAFDPKQGTSGGQCDYYSTISWLDGDLQISQDRITTGQPTTLQNIAVRQLGYLPAVRMRGWDDAERPLAFQSGAQDLSASDEIEILFPSPESQRLVLISGHSLFLMLTYEPTSTVGKPALHVFLLRNGSAESLVADATERQPLATLHESGSVTIYNLTVAVELDYHPVLRVDHRPGMQLVVGGLVLAVIALAVACIIPPRLAWMTVGPGEEGQALVRILALPGDKGSRWLPQLASRLQEMLSNDP